MKKLPKRIILSRKGFDSSAGGHPNWIFKNKLYPIPIPQAYSGIAYKEMQFENNLSYFDVMKDLGITQFSEGHLDPDIHAKQLSQRKTHWQGIFGQHGAALSHLNHRNVGEDDLFLFFGWFKQIDYVNNKFSYVKEAPDIHVVWGYLEVDQIIDFQKKRPDLWMQYHPHYVFREDYSTLNSLFLAKPNSTLFPNQPGAAWLNFHEKLILTKPEENKKRGQWLLPRCFFDNDDKCLLSYHEKRIGKKKNKNWYEVAAANRGQEFVLNTELLPKNSKLSLIDWLENLILNQVNYGN